MKRFRRWLFNGLAALSLLLCVATTFLWIGSYFFLLNLNWSENTISWGLVCSRGEMSISRVEWGSLTNFPGWNLWISEPRSMLDEIQSLSGGPWRFRFREFGFAIVSIHKLKVMDGLEFIWPCWPIALITVAPVAVWITQKRVRPRPGHCPVCGYDLRATPVRCPECGTIPEKTE
jgi:hypothetical protein